MVASIGSSRLPRWFYLLVILIFGGIIWGAIDSLGTIHQERKEKMLAVVDSAANWANGLTQQVEDLELALEEAHGDIRVLTQRITDLEARSPEIATVNNHLLNLKAVDQVCHHGKRAWAVRYHHPDGSEGWFIAPMIEGWQKKHGWLALYDCDGSEKVHPSDRDKILEEAAKDT